MTTRRIEIAGIRHVYIEYNNSGVLGFKRLYTASKFDEKITSSQLEYSGDGRKFRRMYGYQSEGTIDVDTWDDQMDSIIWSLPNVSPQGGDDFYARLVKGNSAEMSPNFLGIRVSRDAFDGDTGAPLVVRTRILKAQFAPNMPSQDASEAITARTLTWNARIAYTDIAGNTLTGMPSNGAFSVIDFLSNTANFDPVPGDVY